MEILRFLKREKENAFCRADAVKKKGESHEKMRDWNSGTR